jgi:hypothetical protein
MFTVFQKKMTVLSSVSNAYVDDTDCPFYHVTQCVWQLYYTESLFLLAHFRAPAVCGDAIERLCSC